MSKRDKVMLVTALSLSIVAIMQGSVFDTTRVTGVSLASLAAAITHVQDDGKLINGNNPNQPSTPTNRQSSSDIVDTSFKNIALQSNINDPTTQTANLTAVFKQVENSVVQITARTPNPNLQVIINGNPLGGQSTRLGSGFVYDKQGHIITNSHVIDGATTADITFIDGNTYTAKVIGKDTSGDIAVLQITDNFSSENLVPLTILNSSSLQVGQQVIAIGNPFGLSDTMTTGIVSQMGRLIPNPDTGFSIPGGIQTDAPINPGNSGGPLLNTQGQVIGINTAINSATGGFSGIGFAVPSNAVIRELATLTKTGTFNHPWLGIAGGKITPDLAQSAGLPRNYKGVVVGTVQAGSPAEKAGLQAVTQNDSSTTQHIGDIITGVDGHPLRSIDDLINHIDLHRSIGDNVVLAVNRHGQIMNLNLVLQARPPSLGNPIPQESILP
ncbi:MAG TPA: trypsin-like peptidase domain-containing protein [Candidatus Nitrosopolaris rasttigaisensis]|nr:trypsin-like peptidase domain-containing protein [Candidatus Nitrosopolaris rasttigaisensis]